MVLNKILNEFTGRVQLSGDAEFFCDYQITNIVFDSREACSEAIFACVKGEHVDGHDYALSAFDKGCRVFLCQQVIESLLKKNVLQIVAPNVRSLMGEFASVLYNRPSQKLVMIAVTGTNGKTTSAYAIHSVLTHANIRCGVVGTIANYDGCIWEESKRTTPEGPDLQLLLAKMRDNGCTACVMEASSHGIEQGRISGCQFDFVAFSNLTADHLDYHKNIEMYFAAKKQLFMDYTRLTWAGAVNRDDDYGKILLQEYASHCVPYSINESCPPSVYGRIISETLSGMEIEIRLKSGGVLQLLTPFIGSYNLQNILQTATIAELMGLESVAIKEGIENLPPIPGRLERYFLSNGVCCVIDFAHTPDALQKLLETVKELCDGTVYAIWGAGGDRSTEKRPLAGKILGELADFTLITSDNPRTEDPTKIAADVYEGVLLSGSEKSRVVIDRREAIHYALDHAQKGDLVVIAGKGPEKYMIVGHEKIPFQDIEVVRNWAKSHSVEIE